MADTSNRGSRSDLPRSGSGGPHLPRRPGGGGDARPTPVDDELLRRLDREEPLSIAEELDKAAENLRHYPNFCVVIEGHTGLRGDAEANRELSELRAEAVSRWRLVIDD